VIEAVCSEDEDAVCEIVVAIAAMSAITITLSIFCKFVLIMRFILEISSSAVSFRVSLNFSFVRKDFAVDFVIADESSDDVVISCFLAEIEVFVFCEC
jgi:hypothetical protein